jgi:hypothetical protein
MAEELDFDRFGNWLLEHNLSIGVATGDPGRRPFRIYREWRCIGQGSTLAQALREAGALGGTESG